MATKKTKKNEKIYGCNFCYFNTCKKTDYNRHLLTDKHKNNSLAIVGNILAIEKTLNCENCNKVYNTKNGLWRHKKKCILNNETINIESIDNEPSDKELIILLLKQNAQLIEQNSELVKNGIHNTTNNTINNNNSHNKTFNLQFFLNETCKDAMNIMDFVDSIKLQLSDLENVGKLGYVEGISNIIIKNLNNLDVEKRPVHCTDSKREVLYVKDENQWYNDSKEENENKKIRKAIKHVTHKNSKILPEFKAKYPDCIYSDSKKSDQYNKIIIESLNDSKENENKIIKKIAKEVIVDK